MVEVAKRKEKKLYKTLSKEEKMIMFAKNFE